MSGNNINSAKYSICLMFYIKILLRLFILNGQGLRTHRLYVPIHNATIVARLTRYCGTPIWREYAVCTLIFRSKICHWDCECGFEIRTRNIVYKHNARDLYKAFIVTAHGFCTEFDHDPTLRVARCTDLFTCTN